MREIEFRVVVDGKTVNNEDYVLRLDCGVLFERNSETEVYNFILEQYTGLKDCDGRKIFEGDILKNLANEQIWTIRHGVSGEYCGFMGVLKPGITTLVYHSNFKNCKIIGNIHKN